MENVFVPILVFLAVMAIGGAFLLWRWMQRQRVLERLRDMPELESPLSAGTPWGGGITRLAGSVPMGSPSAKLRQTLAEAGYHARDAATVFLVFKMLLLVGGLIGASALMFLVPVNLLLRVAGIAVLAGLSFFVPNLVVDWKRRQRRTDVRMNLPGALDLLEICVTSGMGLDTAWNQVTREIRGASPVLADEMALTNLEIHLGAPRAQAMRHMADRTDSQEIRSLVAILVQSERFGTSISETIKTFSASMRQERSMRAEEAAETMSIKLLIPMIVFIFPVLLVVTAVPGIISVVQELNK